jgi:hypothetical protein
MATKFALSGLALDEVSFVDPPANRLAKVVLFKRATKQPVEKDVEGVRFHAGFMEDGASAIQSVSFDLSKWDEPKAEAWLVEHGFKAEKANWKVEKSESRGFIRYECQDVSLFKRLRVVCPGAQICKVLNNENSYQTIQNAVDAALRNLYQGKDPAPGHYLWIRDLFSDNVVFDQDGETWRAPYTITTSPTDEMQVNIGPKVCVDVEYVDESEETTTEKKEATVPAELIFKLGQLQARQKFLDRKVQTLEKDNRDHAGKFNSGDPSEMSQAANLASGRARFQDGNTSSSNKAKKQAHQIAANAHQRAADAYDKGSPANMRHLKDMQYHKDVAHSLSY